MYGLETAKPRQPFSTNAAPHRKALSIETPILLR